MLLPRDGGGGLGLGGGRRVHEGKVGCQLGKFRARHVRTYVCIIVVYIAGTPCGT